MKRYNMRIANRANITKDGVYPFSIENVNNMPNIEIFIEDSVNEKIML